MPVMTKKRAIKPILASMRHRLRRLWTSITIGVPAPAVRMALPPGGILPTDHIHRATNDGTCSRCRKPVPDDEVGLMRWSSGHDLLVYCDACCLDTPKPEANTDEHHA